MKDIPKSIGNLMSLKILSLDWEKMTHFPTSMKNIHLPKKIDLSNKNLRDLPKSIGNLISLEYLNLSGNELERLPESRTQLLSLKIIYLHNNLFKLDLRVSEINPEILRSLYGV